MSRRQRVGAAVLCLAIVLALALWLRSCLGGGVEPGAPVTATPPSPSPTTASALQVPRGYRLAGVAVGEPASFAVVEAPNGANVLYRMNADIPGLGRLVRIEAERIVVQSDAGPIELWLMPAASPTPTRVRAATVHAATAVARTAALTPTPKPPPAGGASTPGSTP